MVDDQEQGSGSARRALLVETCATTLGARETPDDGGVGSYR